MNKTGSTFAATLAFALPPVVLSAWAVVMLHTWVTGRTKMLLHPFFQPLIAISGVLLLLLAIAHLCYYVKREISLPPARLLQWFLLLCPILAAAAYAPPSFSAQMIAARGIQTTSNALDSGAMDAAAEQMLQSLAATDPAKPLPIDVVDLVSASGVGALAQKLEGRTVRLRGQAYQVNGSDFKVLRLVMYCCAADATPIGVRVHGQLPPQTKNMDWIELDGVVHFIQSLGQIHPEVDATTVQKVPTPDNPYGN